MFTAIDCKYALLLISCCSTLSAFDLLLAFLTRGDRILEAADDFGSSESLRVVLIFTPEPAAFEVEPRGLLHSVSLTSSVSLICADGGGVNVLPLLLSYFKVSILHSALLMTNDVRGKCRALSDCGRSI